MIEIKDNPLLGSGFDTVHTFETWKTAFITSAPQYKDLQEWKRHLQTDELFVLLCGNAVIYTLDDALELVETPMQAGKVYNVSKGTWHHVKVQENTTIFVVENSNTSKYNTEKMTLSEWKNVKENRI